MKCKICGVAIEPYEPGTSLLEDLIEPENDGAYHTACLYAFKRGEQVPEVLR